MESLISLSLIICISFFFLISVSVFDVFAICVYFLINAFSRKRCFVVLLWMNSRLNRRLHLWESTELSNMHSSIKGLLLQTSEHGKIDRLHTSEGNQSSLSFFVSGIVNEE